jgi:hypothetical protein
MCFLADAPRHFLSHRSQIPCVVHNMPCVSLAARLTLILGADRLNRLIALPGFFCDHSRSPSILSAALAIFGHTSPGFANVISVWKWEELTHHCARSVVATILMLQGSHTIGIDVDVGLHNLLPEMHIKVHEQILNETLTVNVRFSASQQVVTGQLFDLVPLTRMGHAGRGTMGMKTQ